MEKDNRDLTEQEHKNSQGRFRERLYIEPSQHHAAWSGAKAGAVFLIADIATYSMVGFTSASSFATYLFGFSKFKGSLPYIPGLYDVLFAFYIITSGVAFALHRK